jgi:two-component system chemotaxis sensor kinase CheA
MKKTWFRREYLIMAVIVALFFFGSVFSVLSIWYLHATTRVVNYVGIVRASSQMMVTQELMGLADDRIIERIEEIINELTTGEGPDNLILLPDRQYSQDMDLVRSHWERIKLHISGIRLDRLRSQSATLPNSLQSQILFDSNMVFYELLNSAASSAEAFSSQTINRSRSTIIGAGCFSILVIIFGLFYLQRLRQAADAVNDEITAMKDNLKIGLFFMDKDFIIQPQYSKSLETLLEEPDLNGSNFSELLVSSITEKERETLKDYFTMVINRSFDPQMLEDINPIYELKYTSARTRNEKILSSKFVSVDRGGGKIFILGLIEDITSQKQLKTQLAEEESKREEEMRSLFEIIQIDPRIFNDFLEDTEYEFSRINDMLKNKELSSNFAIMDVYQSIHAIKSNAVILGLENFSEKLQSLEAEIKKSREQETISFEDILHITIEIDQIMWEKDKLRQNLDRLRSFRISEIRNPEEYVLVQSLSRASDKTARDLGKQVQFVVDSVDPRALENAPRRIMKEVLTQLVRNAVYHGIEDPRVRLAAGKDATGTIRLSINMEHNKIHIKLTDDGQGLDFSHIREKAQEMKMLKEPGDVPDKRQLVQLIFVPGFSTAEDAGLHAGRGVGLSLVRERLHEINAAIKLHTEEGKGTVFNIFIPVEAHEVHETHEAS